MSCLHHETLPTELWLEIFGRLDDSAHRYSVSHAPFQPIPGIASEGHVGSDFAAVVLVCRNWQAWALGLLYRHLKLSPSRSEAIGVHRGYGRWVRRAVVPYSTTSTETCKPMPSTEILGLCPNLEVLVRPPYAPTPLRNLKFEFDSTCPPLASLKRLDFWNHLEASRSGGINSLTVVLAAAPNLEYLFVGGSMGGPFHGIGTTRINLPRLHTLRLAFANALLLRDIVHRWTLPALDNLVVDSPMPAVAMVWETMGPQLRVVEFSRHLRFLLNQTLTPCLRGCPSVCCLNYYVFITMPPEVTPEAVFPSVTSIGIHLSENPYLEAREAEWAHLQQHFDAFAGGMFPNLRRLRLFGARESLLADVRFAAVHQRLSDRNCLLEFPDGTPV
ncbi:hypothetical protein DFH07DRAFT_410950 [Mycena maculata]|uniref:F-box domain-containing protein n=1 Tax=Mycena maculata TaxID=230809 RepID=A0AAD7JF81_9AGAR|nr:hypothetical protein DFH07DRAFT_410950 [Mycena maculata]